MSIPTYNLHPRNTSDQNLKKFRVRDILRPIDGKGDIWIGEPPTRQEIEEKLKGDQDAINLIFEWSMWDLVNKYLKNEKLKEAILGQGIIGISFYDK